MFCALLAPECMAIWAMQQWITAGEIAEEFNQKHGDKGKLLASTVVKVILTDGDQLGHLQKHHAGSQMC